MADEEQSGERPVTPLQVFPTLFDTQEGQDWAVSTAAKVQEALQAKAIVDMSTAAGDQAVQNLDRFKSGLVDFARKDPSMTGLALDLVPDTVNGMLGEHADEHGPPVISHIQAEIARSGIQSAAILDEGAGRRALDQYGAHITDTDRAALGSFIDTMELARKADHVTQVAEVQKKQELASDTVAHGYLSALTNQNGDTSIPNNWLRDMAADPRMKPENKAALWEAHDRIRTQGDPPYSDPSVVVNLIDRMANLRDKPTMAEVLKHAGDGLSLADTGFLAASTFPQNPMQRREIAALSVTLGSARDILAPPENGLAGQEAFGRFVNWLLPEYRNAGAGSLNPKNENWILGGERSAIMDFMPRGDDMVVNAIQYPRTADRPSLSEIFKGGAMSSGVPVTMPPLGSVKPRQRI